ncbi:MAG: S46 family peptidase, partial [Rheinheimera sp.]|nr:S46 family peptidase [Rheinheimera sp.]
MKKHTLFTAVALSLSFAAIADEGQWQPHQLAQLQQELTAAGIAIPGKQLADLSQYPMNAIVSMGYCSASFVSPNGLVVTNHHCAYNAIQNNSTKENNLIEQGFLAKTLAEELPAGAQERLYITESVTDVTAQVSGNLAADLSGAKRHEAIESNRKALIKSCEADPNYRCAVVSFHHGMEYYQIKQLMLQDVRLVYAPSEAIGNFGGDIDNFEYPRHTGDYAFIRGYVGKDGKPAPYSVDNVPYQSKAYLKVNANGVREGDGILLAGYPGRTSRYRLADEIAFAANWQYPAQVKTYQQMINTIDRLGAEDADLKVKYASTVKSLNNRM